MSMWMKFTLVGVGGALVGSLGTIGIQKLCEKTATRAPAGKTKNTSSEKKPD